MGICKIRIIGERKTTEQILRNNVMLPTSNIDENILRRNSLKSFEPYCMVNTALHPIHKPIKTEVIDTIRAYDEPTAAKASAPKTRPTINVSAIL